MGCTASKVAAAAAAEAEAESHGDRLPRQIRRRIEEIRCRKQWRERRKDSIVSTTQLLSADEEHDFEAPADGSLSSGNGDKGSHLGSAGSQESIEIEPPQAEETKEEGENEKEEKKEEPVEVEHWSPEIGKAAEETKEKGEGLEKVSSEMDDTTEEKRKEMDVVPFPQTNGTAEEKREEMGVVPPPEMGCAAEEEEEPRSPSFRIYFVQRRSADSDDSIKPSPKVEGNNDEKAKEDSDSSGTSTSPHSEGRGEMKSTKKERGRRLKALTKAPSRVYYFMHCYNHNHVNSPTSSVTDDDHHHSSPRVHSINGYAS